MEPLLSSQCSTSGPKHLVLFSLPPHVGHVNPSLPLARKLVELGHVVHYVSHEQLRLKIEGTGAVFHSAVDTQPELYVGRGSDYFSMFVHLKAEFGVDPGKTVLALWQLRNIMLDLQLPGLLRLFHLLKPTIVVFCPLSSPEGGVAARVFGIPGVALNTFAGPGGLQGAVRTCLESEGVTPAAADELLREWPPNRAAVQRLWDKHGLRRETGMRHVGFVEELARAALTLTTTSEDLQDPIDAELERAYQGMGAILVSVGPLMDTGGAWKPLKGSSGSDVTDAVMDQVKAARAAARPVVLVSMGTVVTGNIPYWGWNGQPSDAQGRPCGLSGRQLCQAAWSGAFEAFGSSDADDGALIVVALGPQADALSGLRVPPNACTADFLPQVDVLREGVAVFLTHGGQNSFTEALAHGTPLVVCPGFSDQIVNSRKAVALGVGLKVDRPNPEFGAAAVAAAQYCNDVGRALQEVLAEPRFRAAAEGCAEQLASAGGVDRAVELLLGVATRAQKSCALGGS